MFSESAKYYDALYAWKNYQREANQIEALIQDFHPLARTVLDVGCGTAEHHRFISPPLELQGLDLDPNLLEIAQEKFPWATFHLADMSNFDLGQKFDAVICLFSSIGYVATIEKLNSTIACFARHLNPGGIVIVEPWFAPSNWTTGRIQMLTVDQEDLKICRMAHGSADANLSVLELEYLVAEKGLGIRHIQERHVLAMFEEADFVQAFHAAGLQVDFDPKGLTDRGLYIGKWD